MAEGQRKPLTGLGCGCAGLVALAMALVVASSVAVWRALDSRYAGQQDDAADHNQPDDDERQRCRACCNRGRGSLSCDCAFEHRHTFGGERRLAYR